METLQDRPIQVSMDKVNVLWNDVVMQTNDPEYLGLFRKNELGKILVNNTFLHQVINEQFATTCNKYGGPEFAEEVRSGQLVGHYMLRNCCNGEMPRLDPRQVKQKSDFYVRREYQDQALLSPVRSIFDILWSEMEFRPPSLQEITQRFTKSSTRRGALMMFMLFAPYTAEVFEKVS